MYVGQDMMERTGFKRVLRVVGDLAMTTVTESVGP